MEQLTLEMSLEGSQPNLLPPLLEEDQVCPLPVFLHGETTLPAPHASSACLYCYKKWGMLSPASLDFLSVEVSLSVRHMCPVCFCHVVRGLSLWGRPVVVQLCQEWVDKFV